MAPLTNSMDIDIDTNDCRGRSATAIRLFSLADMLRYQLLIIIIIIIINSVLTMPCRLALLNTN